MELLMLRFMGMSYSMMKMSLVTTEAIPAAMPPRNESQARAINHVLYAPCLNMTNLLQNLYILLCYW